MAKVQLTITDEECDRFVLQAQSEGLSLCAWLRAIANKRIEEKQRAERFVSTVDVDAFFKACGKLKGPESEPDWEEHLNVMEQSRACGLSDT